MSKFEVKCTRPGCGQGVETPDIDEVMAWSAAHDEACPALKTGGSGESAERHDEPMYELAEGGSTLRVYPHIAATLDDLLTIEINGPADSVRLSWSDALELSDAIRDLIGQGTFKEDALREAEKRGAVKALRAWADFATTELEHCPSRERRDEAVLLIEGIRSEASRVESGEVTL